MPMVGGKEFPYTKKGMADAKKASGMTGKSMMGTKSNMPARVGDTGTKSNMPVAKGADAKKQALKVYGKKK